MKNPLVDLDEIKVSPSLKESTLTHIYHTKHRSVMVPLLSAVAIACLLLMICIPQFLLEDSTTPIAQKQYSYISMDINPSIQFQVDESDTIQNVNAYNQDGEALLAQLEWSDRKLTDCMQELIDNPTFQNYMENGYLQISIYSEDDQRSNALETTMDTLFSHYYSRDQYGCHHANDTEYVQASHHQMSMGCYQMIERILAIDDAYQFEDLSELSIAELRSIYQECHRGNGNHGNHNGGYGGGNGHHNNRP